MAKFRSMRRNRAQNVGSVPGTIRAGNSEYFISEFLYDSVSCQTTELSLEKLSAKSSDPSKKRLLVFQNYMNTVLLTKVKDIFKIHSLTIEDIINTDQRSKYESYENYDFFVINKFTRKFTHDTNGFEKKQVSIILMEDVVLLFIDEGANRNPDIYHEFDLHFEYIAQRLEEGEGRVRERDLGYLTYVLLDAFIDSYFEVIEELEFDISKLDQRIESENDAGLSKQIFAIKQEIINFKKTTWPLREMVNGLIRNERSFVHRDERNVLFIRDLQDHIHRITETADSLRDTAYNLVDVHVNLVSIRMNDIMKFLTIITSIFVPITFFTSVYGMNFDNIPELHYPHAYEIFWAASIGLSVFLIWQFKKRKWL